MKHLLQDADGTWQMGAYLEYLNKIRHGLPPGARDFAFAAGHFELNHPRSTHDCRFGALTIWEQQVGDVWERSAVAITARYLGSYGDAYLELNYQEVVEYQLTYAKRQGWQASRFGMEMPRAHWRLIVDEIRLDAENFVWHEIEFDDVATLQIQCKDVTHRWHSLTSQDDVEINRVPSRSSSPHNWRQFAWQSWVK